MEFEQNSDLVALGLGWEYIDHEAMYRLAMDWGIRIHMPAFDLIPVRDPHLNAGQSNLVHRYYAEMAHYADTVTSISIATREALESFYRAEDLPVPHLHVNQLPSFEPPDADDLTHRFGDEQLVLSVSTIEIRKNHLLLAKIWAECIREGQPMPRLVLVGRSGWDATELYRWVEHAPELEDHVSICSDVGDDELFALYRDCEFTLFPSRAEGWGLPISESLGAGKVCIHADDPAQFEASQHLMPALHPDDFVAWKAEILRMLRDVQYRSSLEADIHTRYRPRLVDEYVSAYEHFLIDRRQRRELTS